MIRLISLAVLALVVCRAVWATAAPDIDRHRGGLQDPVGDQVGQERRRNQRIGGALRRPEHKPGLYVARVKWFPGNMRPSPALPSERPLLRGPVRHLVDGHRREVRSRARPCPRPPAATSFTTPARSTTTALRTKRRSSRCGAWARRRRRRPRSADQPGAQTRSRMTTRYLARRSRLILVVRRPDRAPSSSTAPASPPRSRCGLAR